MVAAARLVQRSCRRGLDAMTLDAMRLLRPIDEKARAIRAFDLTVACQVEIDLGVAERAAAAIASGDHGIDIDRLERLHRNLLSRGGAELGKKIAGRSRPIVARIGRFTKPARLTTSGADDTQ